MKASLGELAYQGYGDALNWRIYGAPMLRWSDVHEDVRRAWEFAAWHVYRETALTQVDAIASKYGTSQ